MILCLFSFDLFGLLLVGGVVAALAAAWVISDRLEGYR